MNQNEYHALASSHLVGCRYDEENETLYIEFTGGARYAYASVEPEVYQGLLNASSPGSYFHNNIKDQYSYSQV